ncbi:hypothetical protein [Actinomadura harenae]|nr:hypothetical protein [Actinomadura harenae]
MPEFDWDGWEKTVPTEWKDRRLHWHCHSCRMEGETYGNEAARRDLATEYAPKLIRDWLRKPVRTVRRVAMVPEDGVAWLREQWAPIRAQAGEEAEAIPDAARFGRAEHALRGGADVCWGFWLNGSTHLHLAIVGTSEACHA